MVGYKWKGLEGQVPWTMGTVQAGLPLDKTKNPGNLEFTHTESGKKDL